MGHPDCLNTSCQDASSIEVHSVRKGAKERGPEREKRCVALVEAVLDEEVEARMKSRHLVFLDLLDF